MTDTPQVLFKNRRPGETVFLDGYRKTGGYQGLDKALKTMSPAEVRETVKASGLRGRGGAGFSTGLKWSFFPADAPGPKYLVCNGDEMEPGTYKDRVLLETDPHQLVEGMITAAYALQVPVGFIFIRYAYEGCPQRPGAGHRRSPRRGLPGTGHPRQRLRSSSSTSTAAPGATSAAKKPPCSTASKGSAPTRAASPLSRRSRDCSTNRPRSTTSRPWPTSTISSRTAATGSRTWR